MPDFDINDFSGGITDVYLDAPKNTCERMDNLLINRFKEVIQRFGINPYRDFEDQIPAGTQKIDSLYYFEAEQTLFVKSGTRLYYFSVGDTAWTTLDGPNTHAFIYSEVGGGCTWNEWRGHLFITSMPTTNKKGGSRTVKVYKNSSNIWTCIQAGMPLMANVTTGGIPVAPSVTVGVTGYYYQWYVVFTHTYTAKVDGQSVQFKDYSSARLDLEGNYDPISGANSNNMGSFTYTNLTEENFPVANMKVEAYRTEGNQTIPKYVGSANLGASIIDTTADASLGDPLYIAGGVLDNEHPPRSYGMAVVDGYGFYFAGVDVVSEYMYNTRVYQSHPRDVDSVPSSNYCEVAGKVNSGSYVNSIPVAFTEEQSFRIEGRYDLYGGGGTRARLISASEGCIAPESIIRQKDFVLFWSKNGICWTDAYKVINLTENHLKDRYAALLNKEKVSGAYHAAEQRAYWACEEPDNSPSSKNNAFWVMDTFWSKEQAVITTISAINDNLQANSVCYDATLAQVVIGDSRGYVLSFDEDTTYDIVVDTGAALEFWETQGIVPDYISPMSGFGSTKLTKWVTKLYAVFKNVTGELSIDFISHNDDKTTTAIMKSARIRSTVGSGLHKLKRWFVKNSIRCYYKQIQIRKGALVLFRSDDYAPATPNNTTNVVVLDSGSWPTHSGHYLSYYYIYFESDDYTTGYQILSQSADTLTLSDPGDDLPTGSQKWVIRGHSKTECFPLKSITMEYQMLGNSFKAYEVSEEGDNA